MTISTAIRIARAFGLHLVGAGGHSFTLLEERSITLTASRAARISAAEWRATCSNIVHHA